MRLWLLETLSSGPKKLHVCTTFDHMHCDTNSTFPLNGKNNSPF